MFLAESAKNSLLRPSNVKLLILDGFGNIHVLRNHKMGGGGKKWQFLITFSTESNHKGEGRSENPQS